MHYILGNIIQKLLQKREGKCIVIMLKEDMELNFLKQL